MAELAKYAFFAGGPKKPPIIYATRLSPTFTSTCTATSARSICWFHIFRVVQLKNKRFWLKWKYLDLYWYFIIYDTEARFLLYIEARYWSQIFTNDWVFFIFMEKLGFLLFLIFHSSFLTNAAPPGIIGVWKEFKSTI